MLPDIMTQISSTERGAQVLNVEKESTGVDLEISIGKYCTPS